jgi:uncharacterized damage-inducible protein DinB
VSRLCLVLEQIEFARRYTNRLLDAIDVKDWFRQPPAGVTHVAWQVGHLAMAEYRMTLERIRGARPEDAPLISEDFLRTFGIKSVPDADPGRYPSAAEIRAVLDRVHRQAMLELPALPEEELDRPPVKPHSLAQTKLWGLIWCAQHEAVHAGQIGLLRRQLGYPPVW